MVPSPSGLAYEDTYNTLKYADRAQQIKTTVGFCVWGGGGGGGGEGGGSGRGIYLLSGRGIYLLLGLQRNLLGVGERGSLRW